MGAVCAREEARLHSDISNDKQRDCVWRPFQREGLSSYHRCVHILQPRPSQNYCQPLEFTFRQQAQFVAASLHNRKSCGSSCQLPNALLVANAATIRAWPCYCGTAHTVDGIVRCRPRERLPPSMSDFKIKAQEPKNVTVTAVSVLSKNVSRSHVIFLHMERFGSQTCKMLFDAMKALTEHGWIEAIMCVGGRRYRFEQTHVTPEASCLLLTVGVSFFAH